MKITRKGYHLLLNAAGEQVSQHSDVFKAFERAAEAGPGTYTLQQAPVEIVVGIAAPAPEPAPPAPTPPAPSPEAPTPPAPTPAPTEPPQPPAGAAVFEPAITGEPQPSDPYYIDDQGNGPNWRYQNNHLVIPWQNQNVGDWRDAAGQDQGAVPFASALTPSGGQHYTLDATSIVQSLLANGNQGIRLRALGAGPVLICTGRLGANPPTLSVTTDAGAFDCPLLTTPAWTSKNTGAATQNSTQRIQFDNNTFHAGLRFDLSGVTGTVQAAELRLYVEQRFGSNTAIGLFAMRLRPFVLGCGSETPALGLAAEVGEANLAGHADVMMAGDFAGTTLTPSGLSAGAFVPKLFGNVNCHLDNSPDIVEDPDAPGTVMWRGRFVPVSGSTDPKRGAFDGTFLTMPGDNNDPLGPPLNVLDEAYYRMYIWLGADFGAAEDGNKMALTWDLRMGFWKGTYWQNTTGNGGSRGDGRRRTQVVEGQPRYVYQGHMQRMEAGQATVGQPTPVSAYRPILGYNYHIDQAGPFPGGDADPLGGVSYANRLEAKFQRGRWYCVEQYLKMNSIDLTAPDEDGNGEANADGILRTWINGVMTDEQTGYRWRRHPQMGINGVNANWYLGGIKTTTQPMTWAMNHIVLARRYIGPRIKP
jgi:hypothetical protein